MSDQCIAQVVPASKVKETTIADVQLNDDGAPSQVNGYRVLKQLGEGTTSKVYHCTDDVGHEYALKILNKSFLKRKREYKKVDGKMVFSNAFQKVQKEVAIMKKLSHNNLVKLHEIIDSPADDKMVLVLELITGGQVMKWEEKGFHYRCPRTASGVLTEEDTRRCMRNVVDALEYLHRNFICHRDIKPENILLAGEHTYKLADFGVAHMLDEGEDKKSLRNTEGTYHFLAPECTTGNLYDPYRVDIWALGVTMFTLLFGTLPFGTKAASLSDVMDSIRLDPLELDSSALDVDCEDILRAMMTKDPDERITIEQLKCHPWMNRGVSLPDSEVAAEPLRIEVTREEIEAAFTPVNNFILMVRIKMKMAGRLARARNSIDVAKKRPSPVARGNEVTTLEQKNLVAFGPAVIEDLPALDCTTKTDGLRMDGLKTTTVASSIASSIPAMGSILTRRFSLTEDAENTSPPKLYDAVAPVLEATSISKSTGHLKVKSVLKDKLSILEPTQLEGAPLSESQRDVEEGTSTQACDSQCPARVQPARPIHHLSAECLPKLDVTTASRSPSTSPVSSPANRRLTPRFSSNHIAETEDEKCEDSAIVKKSPIEKRNRGGKFHQGSVHPAPSSGLVAYDTLGTNGDRDEDLGLVFSSTPLPPTASFVMKKKTQNEAKAAIVGIVNRTTTDSSCPNTSPVKEPSVMLHRRKSSNTESAYHASIPGTEHGISNHPSDSPLPILSDQARRKLRPADHTYARVKSLAPIPKDDETALKSNPTASQGYHRPLRTEAEIYHANERSFCSNGRASTYATEHLVSTGFDDDEQEVSDSEGCMRSGNSEDRISAVSQGHDLVSMQGCISTHRKPHSDWNEMAIDKSIVHAGSSAAGAHRTDGSSSAKLFGILRKNSNSNVVPLEANLDTVDEEIAGTRPKLNECERCNGHQSSAALHGSIGLPLESVDGGRGRRDSAGRSSPTKKDLPQHRSPAKRMLSNRRSILDSQDSIRLMIMRRSESVKALLGGKKLDQHLVDGAVARHPSVADLPHSHSSMAKPGSLHRRQQRSTSVKSASCAIQ